MANPARSKGTAWEVELLGYLRDLFGPDVHRAPLRGIHDYGDFTGTPWLHEAKSTKAPKFLEWARCAAAKALAAGSSSWCVLWHGDRRTDPTELVVIPLSLYEELVSRWCEVAFYDDVELLAEDDMQEFGASKVGQPADDVDYCALAARTI